MPKRETLNDRYMVKSYRPTPDMVAWVGFTDWYRLEDKMEEDGIVSEDLYTEEQNGKPVLRWQDNDSPYVDHNP